MSALWRTPLLFAIAVGAQQGVCQNFLYVDPGIASCPAAPASTAAAAAAKTVQRGAPVPGSISVTCGFDQGSYTVTLSSTDPGATFSPKSFLVNFGRIVGSGAFVVRFSTVGVHSVSAAITSNMGSPAVRGHFASATNEFKVTV
jgi:hypothetical protein